MLVEPHTCRPPSAHVVVLGNENGGSGKSTTAMHVAIALMNLGPRVATIDLDTRQRSLTRYMENRRVWARQDRRQTTEDRRQRRPVHRDQTGAGDAFRRSVDSYRKFERHISPLSSVL